MPPEPETAQRIARLTPLADVLARIDALVEPVAARAIDVREALGRVLAEGVVGAGRPAHALALRDGFAVTSDVVADASSYAPVAFASPPPRVDLGDAMPAGTDAVAPLDTVVSRNGRYKSIAPVPAGEGVLEVNADFSAGEPLRRSGECLRPIDLAILSAAGIDRVPVRAARIGLVNVRAGDALLEAARAFIAQAIAAGGGVVRDRTPPNDLATALDDTTADAVIAIGGTGSGRRDASVDTLARIGRVEVHGIALSPGETAAFGLAASRPVLLLPGRLDAALAVWLTLGRHLLARLCARGEYAQGITAKLARKVASGLGMVEVVPVRCRDGAAEPLAGGHLPLRALAQADGWILIPAQSEGYPAGAEVVVRPWP